MHDMSCLDPVPSMIGDGFAMPIVVIPGCAGGRRPGIHFSQHSYGIMDSGSGPSDHPGMTASKIEFPKPNQR